MEVKVNMSYVNDEKFQVINKSGNKLIIDMYSQDKKENLFKLEAALKKNLKKRKLFQKKLKTGEKK